jgi:hypothetical protein
VNTGRTREAVAGEENDILRESADSKVFKPEAYLLKKQPHLGRGSDDHQPNRIILLFPWPEVIPLDEPGGQELAALWHARAAERRHQEAHHLRPGAKVIPWCSFYSLAVIYGVPSAVSVELEPGAAFGLCATCRLDRI